MRAINELQKLHFTRWSHLVPSTPVHLKSPSVRACGDKSGFSSPTVQTRAAHPPPPTGAAPNVTTAAAPPAAPSLRGRTGCGRGTRTSRGTGLTEPSLGIAGGARTEPVPASSCRPGLRTVGPAAGHDAHRGRREHSTAPARGVAATGAGSRGQQANPGGERASGIVTQGGGEVWEGGARGLRARAGWE